MKSGIKSGTGVTLNPLSNVIGNSNDDTNFPHKLLITNGQVLRLRKALANNSSANINLSKAQLSKIGQTRGFIGRILGPLLLKTGLHLIKDVLKTLAKSISIPLGLTAAASARDETVQNQIFEYGMATLIIINQETDDIMNSVS